MAEADIYPPDVVTLTDSLVSLGFQDENNSPLSSAPGSPREGNSPLRQRVRDADPYIPTTRSKRVSEAPFDERGGPNDEKKTDGGDELMGKYDIASTKRISIADDSSQPPALIPGNRRESYLKKEPRKPSTLKRAKTTGDIRPAVDDLTKKYRTLSPNASHHNRKPSHDMQQRLKFVALKRDIVSINSVNQQPDPFTAATTIEMEPNTLPVAVTPLQDLKSPPRVVKKQMWNSDPTEGARIKNQIVTPSPQSTNGAWPSFYDTSYESEDLPMSLKPKTSFSALTPKAVGHHRRSSYESCESGDIPMPSSSSKTRGISSDSDNAYHDHESASHPKVYSEEEMEDLVRGSGSSITKSHSYDSQPHDEASIEANEDQPDDEKLHPWVPAGTKNATKPAREAENQKGQPQFSPFHPQGAVRVSSQGQSEQRDIVRAQAVPERREKSSKVKRQDPKLKQQDLLLPANSDVPALFANALVDAVGLAATGAAVMGDFALRSQTDMKELATQCGYELPTSIDNVHPEAADWVNYLTTKGVHSKNSNGLPASIGADWVNSSRNSLVKNEGDGNSIVEKEAKPAKAEVPDNNNYPKITPKKDFQTSEKSAAWLQEEFRRRSIIKQEINDAILERNETQTGDAKNQFANDLTKALEELQAEDSHSATDEEVAALTHENSPTKSLSHDDDDKSEEEHKKLEREAPSYKPSDFDKPLARKLDFQDNRADNNRVRPASALGAKIGPEPSGALRSVQAVEREPRLTNSGSMHSSSNNSRSARDEEVGRTNPIGRAAEDESLNTSLQEEMQRFVSDTRAMLRRDISGEKGPDANFNGDTTLLKSPFRSLAISDSDAPTDDMDLNINYPVQAATDNPPLPRPSRSLTFRSVSEGASDSTTSEFSDMQNMKPALIESMDSMFGIAKGDITLSLLNENTGRVENSPKATWANRVHGAIWRCRRMRHRMGGFPGSDTNMSGSPRRSLPIDMDRARVAGGFKSVASTQEAALNHLRHDEVEEAIELFEDIIFAYYSYFERTLKARELNPGSRDANGSTNFKPYIGVALHNLGILHLLHGDYEEALSFFSRAVENRKACLGEGHRDHVVSLSKLAICLYALNEFGEAHSKLEEALDLATRSCQTLEDCIQVAEILNNLGCLAYMCGQPVAANAFFRDSLDVHFRNLSESLYEPAPMLGQSISLNISITRANIGFVGLVTKELPMSITALENALMEQQILLHGANDTVIATMDHLAVANLLNGEQKKAADMFGRILAVQENEYGRHDRRCFVTMDKIKMVKSQGQKFEMAIEELQKTFSMPQMERTDQTPQAAAEKRAKGTSNKAQGLPSSKAKGQKNKMLKVFGSMRKKK